MGYSYICLSDGSIKIIGYLADSDLIEFGPELPFAETVDETPDWLHHHPVQRLLKLTMDSDEGKLFALSPRKFPGHWDIDSSETAFRPAFADSAAWYTSLGHNTIGAYLLRNFVAEGYSPILEALKTDALRKATATKEVIENALMTFQAAFDQRYNK